MRWTEEETRLAALYGICETCGAPRTTREERHGGGVRIELVCLNGHLASGGEPLDGDRDEHQGSAQGAGQHGAAPGDEAANAAPGTLPA